MIDTDTDNTETDKLLSQEVQEQCKARIEACKYSSDPAICFEEVERLQAIAKRWCWHEYNTDVDEFGDIPDRSCIICKRQDYLWGEPIINPNSMPTPTIGAGPHDLVKLLEDFGERERFNEWHDMASHEFNIYDPLDAMAFFNMSRFVYAKILQSPEKFAQAITSYFKQKGRE